MNREREIFAGSFCSVTKGQFPVPRSLFSGNCTYTHGIRGPLSISDVKRGWINSQRSSYFTEAFFSEIFFNTAHFSRWNQTNTLWKVNTNCTIQHLQVNSTKHQTIWPLHPRGISYQTHCLFHSVLISTWAIPWLDLSDTKLRLPENKKFWVRDILIPRTLLLSNLLPHCPDLIAVTFGQVSAVDVPCILLESEIPNN